MKLQQITPGMRVMYRAFGKVMTGTVYMARTVNAIVALRWPNAKRRKGKARKNRDPKLARIPEPVIMPVAEVRIMRDGGVIRTDVVPPEAVLGEAPLVRPKPRPRKQKSGRRRPNNTSQKA